MLRLGIKDSPGLVWLEGGWMEANTFSCSFSCASSHRYERAGVPLEAIFWLDDPWLGGLWVKCFPLFLMVWKQLQMYEQVWWGDPVVTCADCSLDMKGTGEASIRNHPTHLCWWAATWSCQAKKVAQHLQGFPTLSFSAKGSNKNVPIDES